MLRRRTTIWITSPWRCILNVQSLRPNHQMSEPFCKPWNTNCFFSSEGIPTIFAFILEGGESTVLCLRIVEEIWLLVGFDSLFLIWSRVMWLKFHPLYFVHQNQDFPCLDVFFITIFQLDLCSRSSIVVVVVVIRNPQPTPVLLCCWQN